MSGADSRRTFCDLPLTTVGSILGWLFVAPLAAIIPRRRDWVAVIGRQDGRFLDNAKYFHLQARQLEKDLRLVFITEQASNSAPFDRIRLETLRYPTRSAIWFLLRCGSVAVDEARWYGSFRFFLLLRAQVIQLWHGIGCKRIELDSWKHPTDRFAWFAHPLVLRLRLFAYRLTGRRMCYAAVASTSRFYRDEVFKPAFWAHHFPITGYPRNDFGQSLTGENRRLAWSNVDAGVVERLDAWRQGRKRLVLIAPTFRDSGSTPMQLDAETLSAIDAFAETHGVEFLFKFHPSEKNVDHVAGRHFHVCARDSDVYPLFPYLAALVTDYSSISMDFLLVDKPLLFLIPEHDDYAEKDRQLQFDPRTMMPGPVVPDWRRLLDALLAEWNHDSYRSERAALRTKAFDDLPQSEAVPKLLALMREQGWIATPRQRHR